MKIILIRHFPTNGNEKRKYIGRTDEPLSKRVLERELHRIHDRPKVQRIVTSPLKRCVQTAKLIWPEYLEEFHIDPLLRECDFGLFEGKSYEELKEVPEYVKWLESGGMIPFPGGESPEVFRNRCVEGFKYEIQLCIKEKVESVAFVVHGGTIMSVLERFSEEKKSFYNWQVDNGCGFVGQIDEDEWVNKKEVIRNVRKMVC